MTISRPTKLTVERIEQASKMNFQIPQSFQGGNYTFTCDDNKAAKVIIHYHLCDHFEIFRHDIDGVFTGLGYSNLYCNLEEPFKLIIGYPNHKGGKSKAFITCDTNEAGRVLRFNISLSRKMRINETVEIGNHIMSDFFDRITFYLRIPIAHKSFEVHNKDTNKILRMYVTIPYTEPINLNSAIFKSKIIPDLFMPLVTKYREGMNSVSPLYRCLCFYSAYEALNKIKKMFDNHLQTEGKTCNRTEIIIKQNEFTNEACPLFIGKAADEFFKFYVKKEFRHKIAHMFDDRSGAYLRPMSIEIIHTLDTANQVMSRYLPVLIQQEIDMHLAKI